MTDHIKLDSLSLLFLQVEPSAWLSFYKPLWLAAALLNSGYSYFWDLERDWEIQAFTGPPSGVPKHGRP